MINIIFNDALFILCLLIDLGTTKYKLGEQGNEWKTNKIFNAHGTYCIPYGYLAKSNGDATSGTMIFYGFMIAGLEFFVDTAIRTHNTIITLLLGTY